MRYFISFIMFCVFALSGLSFAESTDPPDCVTCFVQMDTPNSITGFNISTTPCPPVIKAHYFLAPPDQATPNHTSCAVDSPREWGYERPCYAGIGTTGITSIGISYIHPVGTNYRA